MYSFPVMFHLQVFFFFFKGVQHFILPHFILLQSSVTSCAIHCLAYRTSEGVGAEYCIPFEEGKYVSTKEDNFHQA